METKTKLKTKEEASEVLSYGSCLICRLLVLLQLV